MRRKGPVVTGVMRDLAVEMRNRGSTYGEIAGVLGIEEGRARRLLERCKHLVTLPRLKRRVSEPMTVAEMEERDKRVWGLHQGGRSVAEISRELWMRVDAVWGALGRHEERLRRGEVRMRACLGEFCLGRVKFESEGKGHRICDRCRRAEVMRGVG